MGNFTLVAQGYSDESLTRVSVTPEYTVFACGDGRQVEERRVRVASDALEQAQAFYSRRIQPLPHLPNIYKCELQERACCGAAEFVILAERV
jgi:hypothetical protein